MGSSKDAGARLGSIDGLRAVAAIAVFVFHLTWRAPVLRGTRFDAITGHLDAGVEVFFVLSGFLIFGPFAKALVERTPFPATVPYAARRAGRVWPGYLVALTLTVWLGVSEVDGWEGFAKHGSLTFLYLEDRGGRGLAVAWTLVVELSFYAFVPVVARFLWLVRGRVVVASLAIVAVGAWFQHLVAFERHTELVWRVLPPGLLTLGIGMLFASVRAVGDDGGPIARAVHWLGRRPLVPLAIAGIGLAVLALLVEAGTDVYKRPDDRFTKELLQAVIAFGLVLPVVIGSTAGRWRTFLAHPVTAYLGKISFGFYLWHVPVLHWWRSLVVSERPVVAAVGAALALGSTIALAAASWHLVERPVIDAVARRVSPPSRVDAGSRAR